MFKFLFDAVSIGSRAIAFWKVALVALSVAVASSGITYAVGYFAGWRNSDNAHKAAALAESQKHSKWLVQMAEQSGALASADAEIERSNDELQKVIENAFRASRAAKPQCLPSGFLQQLAKLR